MSLAFELEPSLGTSLEKLYATKLKGQAIWLEAGGPSVTTVGPVRATAEGRAIRRVTKIQFDSIKLTGPNLPQSDFHDVTPPSPRAVEFATKVLEPWGRQHNLSDPWCIAWTIDRKLLDRWEIERGAPAARTWVSLAPLEPVIFVPTVTWRRDEEPQVEFLRRAQAQIDDELKAFSDEAAARAVKAGFVRVPPRDLIEEHFTWLVRFQIKGERPADITRSLEQVFAVRARRAVETAIKRTAKLIGLTCRSKPIQPQMRTSLHQRPSSHAK